MSSTQVRQWGCPHLAQVSSDEGGSSPAAMEPVGAWGPAQTAAWLRGESPPPQDPQRGRSSAPRWEGCIPALGATLWRRWEPVPQPLFFLFPKP